MLGLRVHAGFLNSAKELLPQVLNQVAKQLEIFPTTKVLFTGHSAGGAVATLLNLAALKRFASKAMHQHQRQRIAFTNTTSPCRNVFLYHLWRSPVGHALVGNRPWCP